MYKRQLRASPREMPADKLELAAHGLAQILELDEASLLEKFRDRASNDCLPVSYTHLEDMEL